MPYSHSASGSERPRWVVPALVIGSVSVVSLAVGLGVVGPMIQRRMETPPTTLAATGSPSAAPERPVRPAGDVEITERVIPRPKPKPAAPPAATDSDAAAAAATDSTVGDSTDSLDSGAPARPAIHTTVTDANLDTPAGTPPPDDGARDPRRAAGPANSDETGAAIQGAVESGPPAAVPHAPHASKPRHHGMSPLEALPPVDPDSTGAADTEAKPDTVIPPDPNAARSGHSYRVQVGRFDSAADAERLKDELTKAGLSPRVVTAKRGSSVQYRVQVGTFRQKENADREMERLRAQSYQPFLADGEP